MPRSSVLSTGNVTATTLFDGRSRYVHTRPGERPRRQGDTHAAERDHRGPEPSDQPGAAGPRPDPAGLRRQGRHAPDHPDRVHLERLEIVMCTAKNAPKLPALRHNPAVALTIDTEVHPPKILLIRGRAELDVVDGIPDEYLEMNGTYEMTPEQRVEWEAEVRSLYDGMVRIVVTPTWAKLIDFETTLPERGRGAGPAAGGASGRLKQGARLRQSQHPDLNRPGSIEAPRDPGRFTVTVGIRETDAVDSSDAPIASRASSRPRLPGGRDGAASANPRRSPHRRAVRSRRSPVVVVAEAALDRQPPSALLVR